MDDDITSQIIATIKRDTEPITMENVALRKRVMEAEHRAARAERALKDIAAGQENLTIKVNGKIWSKEEIYKQWIEQAEKELAEERKEC